MGWFIPAHYKIIMNYTEPIKAETKMEQELLENYRLLPTILQELYHYVIKEIAKEEKEGIAYEKKERWPHRKDTDA